MTDQSVKLAHVGRFLENLEAATEHASLGAQQIQMLLALYTYGEMTQQGLMTATGVAKTTNSRNIAKLGIGENPVLKSGPGWVESYEDPMDRRNKMVRLTPRGRALLTTVADATFGKGNIKNEGVR